MEKEQEEQKKRETEKRWAAQEDEQRRLREQLKEANTRLEGTAKEQIEDWERQFNDLSHYED